jgi:cytochrome P450
MGRSRFATADIQLNDQIIRAGDAVIMAGNIADRDEAAFPGNPDELDITREARHHNAFGFGIHQCVGQSLARVELQVAFDSLFKQVPGLRLAAPFESLSFKVDRFEYGLHSLPVTW